MTTVKLRTRHNKTNCPARKRVPVRKPQPETLAERKPFFLLAASVLASFSKN